MHFSSLLVAATFAVDTVLAHSKHKPASGHKHAATVPLHKRAGEIITTGAVGHGDGKVHARLEINDLSQNRPDMWSLYVRAMIRWKQVSQDDDSGYLGISAIHGVPRVSWNGVEPCESCGGADGYCTHNSVHFTAWHRAYLALYEQEFLKVADQVARSFDGEFGKRLVHASQRLRVPFWDFASRKVSGLPLLSPAISAPQVTIVGPDGQETVDNPLYSTRISDPSRLQYTPFTQWPNTKRYPDSNAANSRSQDHQVVSSFDNIQENTQDSVYQLLTACHEYKGFATSGGQNCLTSIEGVHNNIHTTAGGPTTSSVSGGQMTYLPLGSYDPLFYSLHTNVDRLFALWQAINPTVYGASEVASHATWTIAAGSTQNEYSALHPFRKSNKAFWTTTDLRDWTKLGYTYPEFLATDGSRAAIIEIVKRLYGPNANETAAQISAQVEKDPSDKSAPSSDRPRGIPGTSGNSDAPSDSGSGIGIGIGPIGISIGFPFGSKSTASPSHVYPSLGGAWNGTKTSGYAAPSGTGHPTSVDPSFIAPNGSYYQYNCHVQTPRFAFNGSYFVYVFDGQPSSNDSTTWLGDKNCIGHLGILAGGSMTGHDAITSAAVPATRYLQKQVKAGKISDMTEATIVPYMKENLNWKIVFDGEEVHPHSLSGYKASFLSGTVASHASYGELPAWSEFVLQVEATKGKAGGISSVAEAIGSTGSSPAPQAPSYAPPSGAGESPVTTAAPPSPAGGDDDDDGGDVTTTIYTTQYVTYCPCKESESTSAPVPSATASSPAAY